MRDSDVVIVNGSTPMGGFQGSLSAVPVVDLGAVGSAALERAGAMETKWMKSSWAVASGSEAGPRPSGHVESGHSGLRRCGHDQQTVWFGA